MKRAAVIIGVAVILGIIAAAIAPMWIAMSGVALSGGAYGAIALMIIFCFAVGGGLMFLIFYSARKGYDDAVHHGAKGPAASHRDDEAGDKAPRTDVGI